MVLLIGTDSGSLIAKPSSWLWWNCYHPFSISFMKLYFQHKHVCFSTAVISEDDKKIERRVVIVFFISSGTIQDSLSFPYNKKLRNIHIVENCRAHFTLLHFFPFTVNTLSRWPCNLGNTSPIRTLKISWNGSGYYLDQRPLGASGDASMGS